MIPKQPDTSIKPITISQAVQKMNGGRPTIHALQKAGRRVEKQKALVGQQETEEETEVETEESSGPVLRSGRLSRRTKKAKNAKTTL